MKFRILTFQLHPKYTYELSHNLDLLLEQKVSELLEDFDPGFDLDFSILCNEANESDLLLGGTIKHRGKRKEITQQLILPNSNLYFEPDYKFYLNRFDFKLMERGYKTYPMDKYIQFTLDGVKLFFEQNSIELPIKLETLQSELVEYVNINKKDFLFENQEKRTLREMINKDHWAYHDDDGQEWLSSDVGKKWLKLASKYTITEDGMLEVKK